MNGTAIGNFDGCGNCLKEPQANSALTLIRRYHVEMLQKSAPLNDRLSVLLEEFPKSEAGKTYPNLVLRDFGSNPFREVEKDWAPSAHRKLQWDWTNWYQGFRRSPNRIEVAAYVGEALRGLFLGTVVQPKDGTALRVQIHYIEGCPGPHELKGQVIALMLDLAEAYALVIGAKELRIVQPLERLIPYYEGYGLKLVKPAQGNIYLSITF
jgi:hypothetical protein